jgi:hypothetical protein
MTDMLGSFFEHYITMKAYHFTTLLYARHVAVDNYINKFLPNMDKFFESHYGSVGRPKLGLISIDINMADDIAAIQSLKDMRAYLDLQRHNVATSLTALIDDMQTDIDQLIYLFKLK